MAEFVPSVKTPESVDDFVRSYLETAEWADKPEDENWDEAAWSWEALLKAENDCALFRRAAAVSIQDLDHSLDQFAHDFWLTRQGHGCGFWDGNYPEPHDDALTALCEIFGELNPYLGDDGRIYFG
jgi:hypothetical protein